MSDKSSISWTHATWNPVTGCDKISAGCKHCYALRDWPRLAANPKSIYFGRAFTDVAVHAERLDQPLRWTRPRMIFVNSMSDLFHKDVPTEFIDRVFAVMGNAYCMDKGHVFQVLTKRADRMRDYLRDPGTVLRVTRAMKAMGLGLAGENAPPTWPLPNVWLGVSVESQAVADERVVHLLDTPSAIRWVSCEPLLGPVDLSFALGTHRNEHGDWREGGGLDWVVVGGESGLKARPMKESWATSLRDQCARAGVPFFFKRWGEWQPASTGLMGRVGSWASALVGGMAPSQIAKATRTSSC
jgi:protein gp37